MGRGKLKLEFIANEKARKTTFQKRKKGMMKKAYEFSVLCGIDVCLFVSGPKLDSENNGSPSPNPNPNRSEAIETWPPEREAVMRIVQKYHAAAARKLPRKASGLADVLAERKRKLDGEIAQCRKKICAAKYPEAAELLGQFSAEELAGLAARLDSKIAEVQLAIGDKKQKKECEEAARNSDKTVAANKTVLMDNKTVNPAEFSYNAATLSGGTGTSALWGPVKDDQTAPGALVDDWINGVANPAQQYNNHYHHHHQMMMMMFGGTSGPSSYLPVPVVPYVPYQYPMNVVNVGPGIGSISQVIRTACEGNSELSSVVNGFVHGC